MSSDDVNLILISVVGKNLLIIKKFNYLNLPVEIFIKRKQYIHKSLQLLNT